VTQIPVIVDTNLLVLLVVGRASRAYISKHKRLTAFVQEDYDALVRILGNASELLVTPHALAEASNLAAYIGEPARSEVLGVLQNLIRSATEVPVASKSAAERQEFIRLGLTDAAMLEVTSQEIVLLSTDLALCIAAESTGKLAMNFNHVRDQYLTQSAR
jgi:hypothetical protein